MASTPPTPPTPRQLLRLKALRPYDAINDQLTSQQIADYVAGLTFENFKDVLLSQLRILLGTPDWWNIPPTTVNQLNTAVVALQQAGTPGLTQTSTSSATCAPTDAVGACVYSCGPENSSGYVVTTADAAQSTTIPAFAVITAKSTTTACTVQQAGEVRGIFTGLTPGTVYYLGNNGGIVAPPLTTGSLVYLQQVGLALSATSLLLAPAPPQYKRSFT